MTLDELVADAAARKRWASKQATTKRVMHKLTVSVGGRDSRRLRVLTGGRGAQRGGVGHWGKGGVVRSSSTVVSPEAGGGGRELVQCP